MAESDMEDVLVEDDREDVTLEEMLESNEPPGRFAAYTQGVRDVLGEFLKNTAGAARERLVPESVRRWQQTATRTGQWLAFVFLWVWIPICFKLMLVFHDVQTSILFTLVNENSEDLAASFITVIDLFVFIANAVSWFLFVQTAGFSWFNFGEADA